VIYRAADVVAVPSYNESFGLVAIEAQASGTPVVAAAVGGLTVAVADGVSGSLVNGHDPGRWADALAAVTLDAPRRDRLSVGARQQAAQFSWDATVDGLLRSYRAARDGARVDQGRTGIARIDQIGRIEANGSPLARVAGR
jgi:D-inositol-3-phosphate glycosyltransferase